MNRRVILKPSTLTGEQASALFRLLSDAIQTQRLLAANCPFILEYSSDLKEDSTAFFVEHEPAKPVPPDMLFKPGAPTLPGPELISLTRAMFEALKAAHENSYAHGGVCPGVVLIDPQGTWKVADFGIVPALVNLLGPESALHLAVGPPGPAEVIQTASGIWRVLPAEEAGRDDRLCGFIDPEKYQIRVEQGGKMPWGFDAKSDVISAGFLLHLHAEHRHPYLDEEGHRYIELSELIWSCVPSLVRRKDLKESPDPAIKTWCELMPKILAPQSAHRPTARDVTAAIAPYVQAIDVEARRQALERSRAEQWMASVQEAGSRSDWDALEALLGSEPALVKGDPQRVATLNSIRTRLAAVRAEQRKMAEEAERRARFLDFRDKLRDAVEAADWETAAGLWRAAPSFEGAPEEIENECLALGRTAELALRERREREEIEAEELASAKWLSELKRLVEAGKWLEAQAVLSRRPALKHRANELQKSATALSEAIQEAISTIAWEKEQAKAWLNEASERARRGEWREAISLLEAAPTLPPGAEQIRAEADLLIAACRQRVLEATNQKLGNLQRGAVDLVKNLIRNRLGSFVDAERISIEVDEASALSTEQGGTGRVTLGVPGLPADSKLAVGFQYDWKADGGATLGLIEGAATEFTRTIEPLLGGLQRDRLLAWVERLRNGLFPDAVVAAELAGLQATVSGNLRLLGEEESQAIELGWDASGLDWHPTALGTLVSHMVAVAARVGREALTARIAALGVNWAAYMPRIAVELVPPARMEGETIPTSLRFEARVRFRGADDEVISLGTMPVVCTRVGEVPLPGEISKAEAALGKAILAAQNASLGRVYEEIQRGVKRAGAAVSGPKKTKSAIATAVFEVKAKSGPVVRVAATWDAAGLAFRLAEGWLEQLAKAAPAAPARATPEKVETPPVKAEPAARETPAKVAAAAAPVRRSGRRGLVIAGGLCAVVVAVVVGVVLSKREEDKRKIDPVPPQPVLERFEVKADPPNRKVDDSTTVTVTVTAIGTDGKPMANRDLDEDIQISTDSNEAEKQFNYEVSSPFKIDDRHDGTAIIRHGEPNKFDRNGKFVFKLTNTRAQGPIKITVSCGKISQTSPEVIWEEQKQNTTTQNEGSAKPTDITDSNNDVVDKVPGKENRPPLAKALNIVFIPPANLQVNDKIHLTALVVNGNDKTPVKGDTTTVTLELAPAGAKFGGKVPKDCIDGVATFESLTIDKPGKDYKFKVTADGIQPVESEAFEVLAKIEDEGDVATLRQRWAELEKAKQLPELDPKQRFALWSRGISSKDVAIPGFDAEEIGKAAGQARWYVPIAVIEKLAELDKDAGGNVPGILDLLPLERALRQFENDLANWKDADGMPKKGQLEPACQVALELVHRAMGWTDETKQVAHWSGLAVTFEGEKLWRWALLARLTAASTPKGRDCAPITNIGAGDLSQYKALVAGKLIDAEKPSVATELDFDKQLSMWISRVCNPNALGITASGNGWGQNRGLGLLPFGPDADRESKTKSLTAEFTKNWPANQPNPTDANQAFTLMQEIKAARVGLVARTEDFESLKKSLTGEIAGKKLPKVDLMVEFLLLEGKWFLVGFGRDEKEDQARDKFLYTILLAKQAVVGPNQMPLLNETDWFSKQAHAVNGKSDDKIYVDGDNKNGLKYVIVAPDGILWQGSWIGAQNPITAPMESDVQWMLIPSANSIASETNWTTEASLRLIWVANRDVDRMKLLKSTSRKAIFSLAKIAAVQLGESNPKFTRNAPTVNEIMALFKQNQNILPLIDLSEQQRNSTP